MINVTTRTKRAFRVNTLIPNAFNAQHQSTDNGSMNYRYAQPGMNAGHSQRQGMAWGHYKQTHPSHKETYDDSTQQPLNHNLGALRIVNQMGRLGRVEGYGGARKLSLLAKVLDSKELYYLCPIFTITVMAYKDSDAPIVSIDASDSFAEALLSTARSFDYHRKGGDIVIQDVLYLTHEEVANFGHDPHYQFDCIMRFAEVYSQIGLSDALIMLTAPKSYALGERFDAFIERNTMKHIPWERIEDLRTDTYLYEEFSKWCRSQYSEDYDEKDALKMYKLISTQSQLRERGIALTDVSQAIDIYLPHVTEDEVSESEAMSDEDSFEAYLRPYTQSILEILAQIRDLDKTEYESEFDREQRYYQLSQLVIAKNMGSGYLDNLLDGQYPHARIDELIKQ